MPNEKKPVTAPKAKVSKPKLAKVNPTSAVKTAFVAKPTAKVAKPAPKAAPKKPKAAAPVAVVKVRTTRGPKKHTKGSFADLLKKQAELEGIKEKAKKDLKRDYGIYLNKAEDIAEEYRKIFSEEIGAAPKIKASGEKKATGTKTAGMKPYSLSEVASFVEQKRLGRAKIKVSGRRPKSIAKMEDAFKQSEEADEILKILNR
jgi:hypothetical protein